MTQHRLLMIGGSEYRTRRCTQMPSATKVDLVVVSGIRAFLRYAVEDLPGAMHHPFVAAATLDRLSEAQRLVKSEDPTAELLIWDAYRTRDTQRAIFERYRAKLAHQHGEISPAELSMLTSEFISDPDGVFPHGTGGAVDVTLLVKADIASMGTDFDEFVPESATDWFRVHAPVTPHEEDARRNREFLRFAMERAGFVGIANEWWHFEYGTKTWSENKMNTIVFDRTLDPPTFACASTQANSNVPRRQPALETGVAQIFTTAQSRKDGLAHTIPAHYYQRNSHPTTSNLNAAVTSMLDASLNAILVESGKAACVCALRALVPNNGRILCDKAIYYEVQREALTMAAKNSWDLVFADFTNIHEIETVASSGLPFDVFYFDNPRNWFLNTVDTRAVAGIARRTSSIIVVDVSVHPIQRALNCGADVVVCSLSKYPSAGLDMGGAIASNSQAMLDKVNELVEAEGHVLGSCTAFTIWAQMITLNDRFTAVSKKALLVSEMLRRHPAVKAVHVPDPSLLGGFVGGQISFQVLSPSYGELLERVVESQALNSDSALHLMCSFGALATSIEHFNSNPRYRVGILRELTNEVLIPADMVRLGIGAEKVEDILDQLTFCLNMVVDYNAISARDTIRRKTA